MFNEEMHFPQPLAWGMIGGGRGSEIGYAHRSAASRDGLFTLCAAALDIDPEKSVAFGRNIGIDQSRCYRDYQTLIARESARSDGVRVLSICTPNATHYPIAKMALQAGMHVICEKIVTINSAQACELKALAIQNNCMFAVMYGYAGYPMIHQAKAMVAQGELGKIRHIHMQFAHGYHATCIENTNLGARWRLDPSISGPSFILSDVGTHAYYLGSFITDLQPKRLLCHTQSFVATRAPLEDNAQILFEYPQGAVGYLWASAVNAGSTHRQIVRVVGEKASIQWWDEHPNQLRFEPLGEPVRILERAMPYLYQDNVAIQAQRIGSGHPEGFFESWANLYHRYALAIQAIMRKDLQFLQTHWYPDIDAGIAGVRMVEAALHSATHNSQWVPL